MKSKSKKIFLAIAAGLIIFALIGFIFWLRDYSQENRRLVDYVPEGAVGYIEFNLADESLNSYLEKNNQAKKLLEEYILANDLPANIWQGEVEIEKLALVTFEREIKDGGGHYLDKAWLIQGRKDIKQLEATGLVNYYYTALTKRVGVLSKSREAMIEIRDHKVVDSLAVLNGKGRNDLMNGYVKSNLYKDELEQIGALVPLFEGVVSKEEGQIDWRVTSGEQSKLAVEIEIPLAKKNFWQKRASSQENFLIVDKSIIVKDILGSELLKMVESELTNTGDVDMQAFKIYVSDKYQVEIEELYTFFEQPTWLVLKPKNRLGNISETLKSSNYFYSMVTRDTSSVVKEDFLRDLETLIQNYLAFKFPEKRIKVLPDGSRGYELLAPADKFEWQPKESEAGEIKFIKYDTKEVAYGWREGMFVLANSVELAEEILAAEVEGDGHSEFDVKFDTHIFQNSYLNLISNVWLASEVHSSKLFVSGQLRVE